MAVGTDDNTSAQRYEGFSDYESVSKRIARSIDEAVQEYAAIQRAHAEGRRVAHDGVGERILAAAMRLLPELRDQRQAGAVFDEILARWLGDEAKLDETDVDPEPPDSGAIEALMQARLTNDCPDWLHQMVIDIRTAGWELGYLKAGRHAEEDDEFTEADVKEMFR